MVVVYNPSNGDFRRFQSKLTKIDVENDVKWHKNKKIDFVGIKWPQLSIKLITKTYKKWYGGRKSPNNGDFLRFQSKLIKIDVENDVKRCQNRKIDILCIKWPLVIIKPITKTQRKWYGCRI